MGNIFGIFGRKNKIPVENAPKRESKKTSEVTDNSKAGYSILDDKPSFVFGVNDTFKLLNSTDLVVVGRVTGTVHPGAAVYVSNVGDDQGTTFLTTVLSLEINQKPVKEAKDCIVALKLEAGQKSEIRKGSVIYTRDQSIKAVHDTYISALGDTYVSRQNLVLSDNDLEMMSITDCAEAWRLFCWFHSKSVSNESGETIAENRRKIDRLAAALCKKILAANEIYCVYNKATGEPHMFSKTVDQKNGSYMCTPPDIMLITKAYSEPYSAMYPADKFEIVKIENGEKGDGIYNFLGSTFYLNGACGISILSDQTSISAEIIVARPDYGDSKMIENPVTNPDLVRWLLLIGQLGKPDNVDAETIYKLYYRFVSIEMIKADLLIPMKNEGEIPAPDENGKTVLKKDVQLNFPTMKGKHERDAVRMFTDWKRLRMVFGQEWGGLIQPVSGIIEIFDCAVNSTDHPAAGCYIEKEMFDEMKSFVPAEHS